MNKPKHCYESGCPLAELGKGFVLGVGDPTKAKLTIILEAPGRDEISFPIQINNDRSFLNSSESVKSELARRKKAYPSVEDKYLRLGAPIVGPTGNLLESWVLKPLGIKRSEIFVDNTLRCLPPKSKQGKYYPTGADKHKAEQCCRHYDRLSEFKPTAGVLSLHPAGILREVTPLPLLIKDVEKAQDFISSGERVMLFLGGAAAKAFARFGDNITRWRGSYIICEKDWYKKLIEKYFTKEYVKTKKRVGKGKVILKAIADMNPFEFTDNLLDVAPKKVRKKRRSKKKVIDAMGDSNTPISDTDKTK
jgi:hypothetical protein